MKVVDIANEIYIDVGSPSTTSIPAIAFWVRAKVGEINNLLLEDFVINSSSYEILDGGGVEITPEAVAIIKKLYKIYDYELQIRLQMSAISTDTILEVADQGSSVKKMNRNEVSKTLAGVRKDELLGLDKLVTAYKQRGALPSQVAGDDVVEGRFNGIQMTDRNFYY
jgi:hypothetical protein